MLEILLLQALVHQAGGDTSQALVKLDRALTLAEPGGFLRIFVDEGSPMAHLLYEALNRGLLLITFVAYWLLSQLTSLCKLT